MILFRLFSFYSDKVRRFDAFQDISNLISVYFAYENKRDQCGSPELDFFWLPYFCHSSSVIIDHRHSNAKVDNIPNNNSSLITDPVKTIVLTKFFLKVSKS